MYACRMVVAVAPDMDRDGGKRLNRIINRIMKGKNYQFM